MSDEKCEATVEDYVRPQKSYSQQRFTIPSRKGCVSKAVEVIGKLALCKRHAGAARRGNMDANGNMASRADLQMVRRYPDKWPRGLHTWVYDVRPPRMMLGPASVIQGVPICTLADGAVIWRLSHDDRRFHHGLGIMLARDARAATDGKPVELYEVDELDQVEWARAREAGRCQK